MKIVNVVLLVLIIIGTYLLFTQDKWVTPLTNYILSFDKNEDYNTGSRWTNKVTSVRTDCASDGVCSVTVGDVEVIIDNGGRLVPPENMGKVIGKYSTYPIEDFVGKTATVYARKINSKLFTLEGNSDFYLEVE